ncbi:cupin domain-containing protein [Brachybacterium sp.]|uniref:cupin domain-containing protein n=1 Tax=Brachybacterium sp. TaxID=1891286 RepID=UPI002ED647E8
MSDSASQPERGAEDRPALRRLTGMSGEQFAREHWGERPLLTHSPSGFEDLFSAEAADELIAQRALRTPFVRMASEGAVLSPSRFTSSGGTGAEVGDQLDSAKVLQEFAAGATLVLQGLHRTWGPIGDFTRDLVRDLGHPAQVNAYITPASSRGFDPHYDTHDVFVLQIAGTKRWSIHEPVHRHPLADQPWTDHRDAVAEAARRPPHIDQVFEPGDVLYLPRGWLHSAVAEGGTSIHLTIGLRATTRQDLLHTLLASAGEDPELRRSLALGVDYSDPASFAEDVRATIAAAHALLDRAPIDDLARSLQRAHAEATRPEPVRPLATIDAMAELTADVLLSWRDALAERIEEDERAIRIVTRTSTVTLPAEAAPAIRALRAAPQGAGDLPGLDAESSLVVSRRLLREGIVVPQ